MSKKKKTASEPKDEVYTHIRIERAVHNKIFEIQDSIARTSGFKPKLVDVCEKALLIGLAQMAASVQEETTQE